MFSKDLRVQLSSVDMMLTSGLHCRETICPWRTELQMWRHWQECWLKRLLRGQPGLWCTLAASPSVSLCLSFWRSSWWGPRWPPPRDRAAGAPEPSEDTSPPTPLGWTHWDHCSLTAKGECEGQDDGLLNCLCQHCRWPTTPATSKSTKIADCTS